MRSPERTAARPLRVFVPSASVLLTDRAGHGEGLIAWALLSGLARRGHEIVACAREVDVGSDPPFEIVETGRASRWESIEPLAYARVVERVFAGRGGVRAFDAVHWLFPEQPEETTYAPPPGPPFVVGPLFPSWPFRMRPRRRLGDAAALALTPARRRRRRHVLGRATAILVSGPAALDALPRSARVRARVVPIGVDPNRFVASRPFPGARIVFAGRLERVKGVRELVDAFAQLRADVPHAELVIAGDGPERPWIERRGRELSLDGSLRLLGAIPHAEVSPLLDSATLVCLPSWGEPYGMALVEAMAAGKPVVACDGGGPRFLVDPAGGRVVRPRNTAALSSALRELVADQGALEAMGRFNRARVESELSLERTLDLIEAAYVEKAR